MLKVKQVSHDLGVGVWLRISQVHSIVRVGELELKIHLVEVALAQGPCRTQLMSISITALGVLIKVVLVHAGIFFIVQVECSRRVPTPALKS